MDVTSLDFSGRVVLVTGASGGIGRAVCRRFAAAGATVALAYGRRAEAAEAVRAELAGDGHGTHAADLRDPRAVAALVEAVIARHGRIDVLVNNAGVFERHPPAEVDYDGWQEHWRRALETNLLGPANLSWCVARTMMRRGGGKIVNVSSRGAFRGEPDSPAYGASKAGLNALGQSLAQALAPHGIFVFTVAPGFVETAMARDYVSGELAESIKRQSPLGRVARPEDVAYWITALAGDGGEFATGTIVDVNGASYLRS